MNERSFPINGWEWMSGSSGWMRIHCRLMSERIPRLVVGMDTWKHWRRIVKNIGSANQNIGGQKVIKSDKCTGVSQLLGARARAAS